MAVTFLNVPGVNNSGPDHWQTLWEKSYPNFRRVAQDNWDLPYCEDWVAGLNQAIEEIEGEIILVAHSLGCLTVVHWAKEYKRSIKGALLVAPADLETPDYPPGVGGFTPIPVDKLSFPSTLVASTNDSFVTIERAEYFANCWGSRFINVGQCGHINVDAGFGPWTQGEELLKELLNK
jgi:uncharacterized protein